MKTLKLQTIASLIAASLCFGCGSTAKADHLETIDRLARTVESQTKRIDHDVEYHLRGLPACSSLRKDVCEMAELADHIHDLCHESHSLKHIQEDLEELDVLFHKVEATVESLRRSTSTSLHSSSRSRFGIHVHVGSSTSSYQVRRIAERVAELDATLHALEEEVEEALGHHHHSASPRQDVSPPSQSGFGRPSGIYDYERRSIRIPVADNRYLR